ncbi:MAG: L-aspartate oxidase [Candidatus Cloacimonadaceae bacterium]|jgi:L-aspartate oxidase|nr:L-aspartate oxidase [Candidatus Cloacimonadota bacterium]MDY0381661.1 L-aspartate oxidase [Candidatus Cloacimonadaceae bacterium]MCK9434602.1 L-aspartate oxidase [Candidatus Cloacimonadota bacterium]MDD2616736.1 L-aspartate oxidase [Candidatus Cloacimonadota bacterium]MDD2719428.1 L-aspartate oxidase [Candidatus Cloacimonadota bacterium]
MTYEYDYLVLGSGIAGLIFALQASKKGRVAIVSKKGLFDCNTDYAQGGIAAVLDAADSFAEHIEDTFSAGAELGKKQVISQIIEQGPKLIQYLIDLGTDFTRIDDAYDRRLENLSLTMEGGHTHRRVAYAADSTGHQIMQALISQCRKNAAIDIFENRIAIDLITQHHVTNDDGFIPGISCWGAYVLDSASNQVDIFKARKTMLATGGAAQIFSHNTNPDVATGDGMAMARLAGGRLANMEFVQFHPTAFWSPEGETFLITEALRGEGAILKLSDGSPFMEQYHPKGNLAPRDIVSRAIDNELKSRGEKFCWLDATAIPKEKLLKHFPYIDSRLRERGIDFSREPIPVAPAAHYFCGGVISTIDGVTDIRNLFAAGEVACTGLHGANRLASNSLLEALVVAYNAANHPSMDDDVQFPNIPSWRLMGDFNANEWVIISHNREIIGTIMQGYVGIRRSRRLLKYALSRLENIYNEINNFYQHNAVRREVVETRNMAVIAIAVIRSALSRKESRGAHYLIDQPQRDDRHYMHDTII